MYIQRSPASFPLHPTLSFPYPIGNHLLKFKSHTLKHSKAKGEITRSKAYLELNRIKDTIKNFRLPLKLYLEGNL